MTTWVKQKKQASNACVNSQLGVACLSNQKLRGLWVQEQAVAGLLREPALPATVLKPLVDGQTKEIRDIARRSEGRLNRIETSVVAGADLQTHLLAEINELRSMVFGLTDTVAQMSRVLKMVGDLAGGVPLPPAIDET